MLAICILSWKSHKTLLKTLESYKKSNLFNYADENLIFFQEISAKDIEIANRYGLNYMGSEKNLGIENAWQTILENVKSPFVLFLEADCPLIEPEEEVQKQIATSIDLLKSDIVDIVRLRHRYETGYKFNILQKYKDFYGSGLKNTLLRWLRPGKAKRLLGASIYANENPEQIHPKEITKYNPTTYITSSKNMNWTNQSVMFKKELMLEQLLPYIRTHPSSRTLNGFQDMEKSLNCRWWRQQDYKIAIGKGLFTHVRWDRE